MESQVILKNKGQMSQEDKAKIVNDIKFLEENPSGFTAEDTSLYIEGSDTQNTTKAIAWLNIGMTTAAVASETFTIDTTLVPLSSLLSLSIISYSGTVGTNGIPTVMATRATGISIDLVISNVHPTNALNGNVVVSIIDHLS